MDLLLQPIGLAVGVLMLLVLAIGVAQLRIRRALRELRDDFDHDREEARRYVRETAGHVSRIADNLNLADEDRT